MRRGEEGREGEGGVGEGEGEGEEGESGWWKCNIRRFLFGVKTPVSVISAHVTGHKTSSEQAITFHQLLH